METYQRDLGKQMLENHGHPNLAILKVGPNNCIVRDDFTTLRFEFLHNSTQPLDCVVVERGVRFRKAPGFWLQLVSLAGSSNLQLTSKPSQYYKSKQNYR
jgi:hypothetical protein